MEMDTFLEQCAPAPMPEPEKSLFAELESLRESLVGAEQSEAEAAHPIVPGQSPEAAYLEYLRQSALELQNNRNIDLGEADVRFSTSLNLRRVREASVCIIGAGGLGNWQWRIVASMGFRRIILYDDDVVGIENVGSQAHSIFDIGKPKVDAVANALLQYRGIGLIKMQKRAGTLLDIIDDLGFCPDVIIGVTDSAEWRNAFIDNLRGVVIRTRQQYAVSCGYDATQYSRLLRESLPRVFLDYRMSLGDWTGFAIPCRAMARSDRQVSSLSRLFDIYQGAAVFAPEEAEQEPCTARGIAYTGANVAAFTGAYLHWWFNTGERLLQESIGEVNDYFDDLKSYHNEDLRFHYKVSFSARDWEHITPTRREQFLSNNLEEAKRRHEYTLEILAKNTPFAELGAAHIDSLVWKHPWCFQHEVPSTSILEAMSGLLCLDVSSGNVMLPFADGDCVVFRAGYVLEHHRSYKTYMLDSAEGRKALWLVFDPYEDSGYSRDLIEWLHSTTTTTNVYRADFKESIPNIRTIQKFKSCLDTLSDLSEQLYAHGAYIHRDGCYLKIIDCAGKYAVILPLWVLVHICLKDFKYSSRVQTGPVCWFMESLLIHPKLHMQLLNDVPDVVGYFADMKHTPDTELGELVELNYRPNPTTSEADDEQGSGGPGIDTSTGEAGNWRSTPALELHPGEVFRVSRDNPQRYVFVSRSNNRYRVHEYRMSELFCLRMPETVWVEVPEGESTTESTTEGTTDAD